MNTLNRCSNNLIIFGDFSFDFLKIDSDSKATNFYDTTSTYLLTSLINKPTRLIDRSQTLIDIFFVSKPYSTVAGIFTFDVSEHYPIAAVFKNFFEQDNVKEAIEYRVISDDILVLCSNNSSKLDFSELLTGLDLNSSVAELDLLTLREYDKACPMKYKTITKKDREKHESQAT